MQRGRAAVVFGIHVSPTCQKQIDQLLVTIQAREVQCGVPVHPASVRRYRSQQVKGFLHSALFDRVVQRDYLGVDHCLFLVQIHLPTRVAAINGSRQLFVQTDLHSRRGAEQCRPGFAIPDSKEDAESMKQCVKGLTSGSIISARSSTVTLSPFPIAITSRVESLIFQQLYKTSASPDQEGRFGRVTRLRWTRRGRVSD